MVSTRSLREPAMPSSIAPSSSTQAPDEDTQTSPSPWSDAVDTFEAPSTRTASVMPDTAHTDQIVEHAFQDLLGRSAGTGGFWQDFAAQKAREGAGDDEIDNVVRANIQASDEYQALHETDGVVEKAFQDVLGRSANGDPYWNDFARRQRAGGASLDDIDARMRKELQASDEYQTKHPQPQGLSPEDSFVHQPNGWTCGPTSLTMALANHGLAEPTQATASQIAREVGANPNDGFPGGVDLMAQAARNRGLQATSSPSRSVDDMRAQLEQGKSLIVNGTHPSGVPHFIYVAGLADDGSFVVDDPASGGTQHWSDADLNAFTHRGNNPPGFAAVWN